MNRHFLTIIVLAALVSCKQQSTEQLPSSAQKNVKVLEQEFTINGLDRERTIRLYLPEDYTASEESYPVLYAHDGQNLFDDSTSYSGEWGLDESLNEIAKTTGLKLIVVGIDNGQEKRMNELSPWENDNYGIPEGKEYMEFIVKQLKPYIDSTYRTLPDRDHTAIMGSSMGGLISHYGIYQYPKIFSKAIILSPSYWFSEDVFTFTQTNPVPEDSRLWLEIGENEGNAVDDVEKMYELILATGHPLSNIKEQVDPEGKHNENSWRRQFPVAIQWLFAE